MNTVAIVTNSKTVPEYVESIKEHLTNATEAWVRVAREFADAKDALSKSDFDDLQNRTRVSYSTVCKLIKIATSERIKQNESKLALIDAWSTLHEIAKLDDEQFEQFAAEYLSSDEPVYFKRSDVERVKNADRTPATPKLPIFATIRANFDTPMSAEDKTALQHEIEKLVARFATSKFVEIEMSASRNSKAGK